MIRRRAFETPCTVEIEHSNDHFHAHVALDGDIAKGLVGRDAGIS